MALNKIEFLKQVLRSLLSWIEWYERDIGEAAKNTDLNRYDPIHQSPAALAAPPPPWVVRRVLGRVDEFGHSQVLSILLIVLGIVTVLAISAIAALKWRHDGQPPPMFGVLLSFGIVLAFPVAAWMLRPSGSYRPWERLLVAWGGTFHLAASFVEAKNIREGGGGWPLAPMATWPVLAAIVLIGCAVAGRRPRWIPVWMRKRHLALAVALVAAWGGIAYWVEMGNPIHLFFALGAIGVALASLGAVWDDREFGKAYSELKSLAKEGARYLR